MSTSPKSKKRKLSIEIFDDYNNIDLKKVKNVNNFKSYLFKKERELLDDIEKIKNLVKECNREISSRCEKENTKHEWIRERENCMYGSSFTLCKNCRIDYYDRSYLHY